MLDVMTEQWTAGYVCKAVAEAYRVLSACEGRVGHRRVKAAMPEFELEYKRPMKGRERFSSIDIWHMELVLVGGTINGVQRRAWLNGGRIMAHAEWRAILIAACYGASMRYSARQMAEILRISESTFRWKRDRAAAIIAEELNRAKVPVW